MVNLMSYKYYTENINPFLIPIDALFLSDYVKYIPEDRLRDILRHIEEVELIGGYPAAKFGFPGVIPWEFLSSGCKTALCIAYSIEKEETTAISLVDAGINALSVCFELLDNSTISGVLDSGSGYSSQLSTFTVSLDGNICNQDWSFILASKKLKEGR